MSSSTRAVANKESNNKHKSEVLNFEGPSQVGNEGQPARDTGAEIERLGLLKHNVLATIQVSPPSESPQNTPKFANFSFLHFYYYYMYLLKIYIGFYIVVMFI
jgi:hypothetical protein